MADKPTVHLTLAKLKDDTKTPPEPFKLGLSGGKIVTFPDFYGSGDAEWSEKLLNELGRRDRVAVWPALKIWLSKDDVVKLQAEKFTFNQLLKIASAASAHYENHYGDLGEGSGSDD